MLSKQSHNIGKTKHGFTLIELSIALVIIGLIVGGVLVGQDLIKGAKKRSLMAEQIKYVTAVTTFKLKYNQFPGDMSSPTTFFGDVFNNRAGDNDGIIVWFDEGALLWKQLALAALIEGDISVSTFSNADDARLGNDSTIPESRAYSGAGWAIGVRRNTTTNTMFFGRPDDTGATSLPIEGVMSDLDVWEIDNKVDDGLPDAGRMRSTASSCVSAGAYTLTETNLCAFEIELGL